MKTSLHTTPKKSYPDQGGSLLWLWLKRVGGLEGNAVNGFL